MLVIYSFQFVSAFYPQLFIAAVAEYLLFILCLEAGMDPYCLSPNFFMNKWREKTEIQMSNLVSTGKQLLK